MSRILNTNIKSKNECKHFSLRRLRYYQREIKDYIYKSSLTNRYANPLIVGQIKLYEAIVNELDYKWSGILLQQDRGGLPGALTFLKYNPILCRAQRKSFSVRRHISFRSRLLSHSKASPAFRSDADRFWLSQFLNSLRRYCAALTSYFVPAFSLRRYSSREKKGHVLLRLIMLESSNFNKIHDRSRCFLIIIFAKFKLKKNFI